MKLTFLFAALSIMCFGQTTYNLGGAQIQGSLTSGATIKTINGSSVLGSGNLTVTGAQLTITTSNGNNPSGTTSTAGVMAGLAKSITPTSTGRILIFISGQATNGTGDSGFKFDIRYGSGAAPSNGNALTGTQVGGTVTGSGVVSGSTTGVPIASFSHQGIVSGLTLSTAYWIDIGEYAVTAGTATFSNINVTIIEL